MPTLPETPAAEDEEPSVDEACAVLKIPPGLDSRATLAWVQKRIDQMHKKIAQFEASVACVSSFHHNFANVTTTE